MEGPEIFAEVEPESLPVGAELLFKAITPAWQSLVTWFSMAASVLGGIALLASGSGRSLPWPGTVSQR